MLTERFPVPGGRLGRGWRSLLFVFDVATLVIFGWETGALLAAIGTFTHVLLHRPLIRIGCHPSRPSSQVSGRDRRI